MPRSPKSFSQLRLDQRRDFKKAATARRKASFPLRQKGILAAAGIGAVLFLGWLALFLAGNLPEVSFSKIFLEIAEAELPQDAGQHTTILLVGHSGGEHDGPDLTDTMIVATLDHRARAISLLSLPRDLFVRVAGLSPTRINSIWKIGELRGGEEEGWRLLTETVEGIIGRPIHRRVRVDFNGFREIVDALGGVEVEVETPFVDHSYPTESFGWQTIRFEEGRQLLDGEKALQFARSRHGNNGQGSDFARAARQRILLAALKEKVSSSETLSDPRRLRELFEALAAAFETNLSFREVLALANFARELPREEIRSFALTDGEDGFLYAPSDATREEFYSGLFVLLPIGDSWDLIREFIDLIWDRPEVYREAATIRVLNGSKAPGLASSCAQRLARLHLKVEEIGNATLPAEEGLLFDHAGANPATVELLSALAGASEVPLSPEPEPTAAAVTLVLGKDSTCRAAGIGG